MTTMRNYRIGDKVIFKRSHSEYSDKELQRTYTITHIINEVFWLDTKYPMWDTPNFERHFKLAYNFNDYYEKL